MAKRDRARRRKERAMGVGRVAAAMVSERERIGQGTATVERLAKAGDGYEVTPASRAAPAGVQRVVAAPLDRLWRDGTITRREYEAGERLRADAYLAAIDPSALSVDWARAGVAGASSHVPSIFNSQIMADARIRFRSVERAIRGVAWDVLKMALIHEHTLAEIGRSIFARIDPREATVAAHAGLRVALSGLADSYGM